MANYRQIHVSIWKDAWFLDLEPDAKLLFIYLFSNELASLAGIYEMPQKVIAFETGLSLEYVEDTLSLFQKADKVYVENGLIWIKNLRQYNRGGATVKTRIIKDIQAVRDCELKKKYIEYHPQDIPYLYPNGSLSYEMKCNEDKCNEDETLPKRSKSEQPFDKLNTAFINASGIPAFGIQPRDVEAGQRMIEAEITPDHVTEAVGILLDKKLTMVGLASVEKTAYNVKAQEGYEGKPGQSLEELGYSSG